MLYIFIINKIQNYNKNKQNGCYENEFSLLPVSTKRIKSMLANIYFY